MECVFGPAVVTHFWVRGSPQVFFPSPNFFTSLENPFRGYWEPLYLFLMTSASKACALVATVCALAVIGTVAHSGDGIFPVVYLQSVFDFEMLPFCCRRASSILKPCRSPHPWSFRVFSSFLLPPNSSGGAERDHVDRCQCPGRRFRRLHRPAAAPRLA